MNLNHARRVVAVYEAVRDRTVDFRYGIPEAVLPYSREEIKRALLRLLLEVEDDGIRGQYAASYLLLSRFVPNEHAHRCMIVQVAMELEDANWLAEQPALKDILQYIHEEQQQLGEELSLFLAGN